MTIAINPWNRAGDHQDGSRDPGVPAPQSRLFRAPYRAALLLRDGQGFLRAAGTPQPEYNLDVGSGSHAEQTGRIMSGVEKILIKEMPDVILVQGDTNTVMAALLQPRSCISRSAMSKRAFEALIENMPEEITTGW